MITSQTIGKVANALVQAQAEMDNASKDKKNPFFKSSYADLNAIREVALPALNKHKVAALQPTVVVDGKKYVQTTLMHESGEFISCLTEILSVKENDAQAQGSGITYARRYGLQSMLNIGAEDDDGNAAMGKKPEGVIVPHGTTPAPLVGQESKKTAGNHRFTIMSPEKEKALNWIKEQLAKQPNWESNKAIIFKKITGVASVDELNAMPYSELTEITKLLLTTYKVED